MVKQKKQRRTWCERNREYEERKRLIQCDSADDYQRQVLQLARELKI